MIDLYILIISFCVFLIIFIFDLILTIIDLCGNLTKHWIGEKYFNNQDILSPSRIRAKIFVLILHLSLLLWSRAEQQALKEIKIEDNFKDLQSYSYEDFEIQPQNQKQGNYSLLNN